MDEPFGALERLTREKMNIELCASGRKRRRSFVTHGITEAVSRHARDRAHRRAGACRRFRVELPHPRTLEMNQREFGEYTSGSTVWEWSEKRHSNLGIIMNGVTGRMGTISIWSADRRDPRARRRCAENATAMPTRSWSAVMRPSSRSWRGARHARWTTDLDGAFRTRTTILFFDAPGHRRRQGHLLREADRGTALEEAPTSRAPQRSRYPARRGCSCRACSAKVPIDSGFWPHPRCAALGYWVFEGGWQPAQRPSWNYRRRTAAASSSTCSSLALRARQPVRRGEERLLPRRDAYRSAGTRTMSPMTPRTMPPMPPSSSSGAVARISSCTRVRRDDLVTFHVDGTHGSAVAGLQKCWSQRG
jgi:hypothetical protein